MKLKKLLMFVLLISMVLICSFNRKIIKASEIDSEKVYCNVTIEDEFIDNEIFITLKNEESLEFNEYTTNDFSEINCIAIEDLTDGYKDKIEQQLNGTYIGNMPVNLEAFNRILKLTLSIKSKQYVLDSIKKLEKIDFIKSAEPNYIIEMKELGTPDDFYYNNSYEGSSGELNWAYESMNMEEAWDYVDSIYDKTDVLVGVYDSGVDGDHEDLTIKNEENEIVDNVFANIGIAYDATLSLNDVNREYSEFYLADRNGHGTRIAGIIAAYRNNGIGISGISLNAKIVSLRDVDQTIENFIKCIEYAEENNIRIINCSRNFTYKYSVNEIINSSMREAIENYPGLLVCGAGNSGKNNDTDSSPCFPASYNLLNIISVGALMINNNVEQKMNALDGDGHLIHSHWGPTSVDLFAPGHEIVVTDIINNGYNVVSGTSYAAPFVTGVAALILSIAPDLSISELKATILNNVTPLDNLSELCVTGGKLNAEAAVKNIHRHNNLDYVFDTSIYHRAGCSCGTIILEPHVWLNNPLGGKTCIKCGWTTLSVNYIIKKEEEVY